MNELTEEGIIEAVTVVQGGGGGDMGVATNTTHTWGITSRVFFRLVMFSTCQRAATGPTPIPSDSPRGILLL